MLDRIVANLAVLGGKPCVRGTRISVEFILELIGSGANGEDIVHAYPHLKKEDVEQAVQYAARFLKNEINIAVETPS
jgi:uncharacterized protein (DUF433 family)